MDDAPVSVAGPPLCLASPSGLRVQLNANGSLRRLAHGDVAINLFAGNEMEGGPTNLYLRRLGPVVASVPLLGPRSPGTVHFDEKGFRVCGEWQSVRFEVALVLAESAPAWFWHVRLENTGHGCEELDLVHAQDVALTGYAELRLNEYYVSQYLDHAPLEHPQQGVVLAVRQNLALEGRHPWALFGSLGRATSFATDALQLYGRGGGHAAVPAGLCAPGLPGKRQQHEHSMAVLQEGSVQLEPGASVARGFFGCFAPDHPAASSPADLAFVTRVLALPEAAPVFEATRSTAGTESASLFSQAAPLACRDLEAGEIRELFGEKLRHVEEEEGCILSFFTGENRHVVLAAKERRVLRPHGLILRTGDSLVPDEASLTSTLWMAGVFHSMLTQGHVSLNRFLSTTHGYLGLFRSHGQRIFVEQDEAWQQLGTPSAFEMDPSGARWFYAHAGGRIEVCSRAAVDRHELSLSIAVTEGCACRFLVSHHVALAGDDGAEAAELRFIQDARGIAVPVPPDSELGRRFPQGCFRIDPDRGTVIEAVGGDELLFADGRSRGQPFLAIVTAPARSLGFRITGQLLEASERLRSDRLGLEFGVPCVLSPAAGSPLAGDVARVQEILPWFCHDALIHHLAPRGLEQYSGGGWGTRDVCQGPLELLLSLGHWEPARDLLLRVFRNQDPDGDWPQWFMFFERERSSRAGDSHGDVVFWPLLALARYLLASQDAGILDERVAFFCVDAQSSPERPSLWEHVLRALAVMAARVIPGTGLAAYGHGDWNDSLQPVEPAMRERLCSAWTVTLQYQTLTTLAAALRGIGRAEPAPALEATAARVRDEFQRLLFEDGVLAGFTYFRATGGRERLLHPNDCSTGIRYRLLSMIHAILAGLFTPEQARAHVALIREHLLAPDGARLFDRPPVYRGGAQRHFQRAESSSFFGREIGILYTHAHLRFAEAMARVGDSDAAFLALRQANPIGLRTLVPAARPRQCNCYSSSSDAFFADRYEASERYHEVKRGEVPLEGGWRVYSSGAGIAVSLVRGSLLGLRETRSQLLVDPVLPRSLDGLRARVALAGREVEVVYRIRELGYGPTAITLAGRALDFELEPNPYRPGAARIEWASLHEWLAGGVGPLIVDLR